MTPDDAFSQYLRDHHRRMARIQARGGTVHNELRRIEWRNRAVASVIVTIAAILLLVVF
jgi:hypothetical protein